MTKERLCDHSTSWGVVSGNDLLEVHAHPLQSIYFPVPVWQVRYYRDTYAEHPEDRKNIEYSVHLDNDGDLITLR
jgi:hypothetical protein